MALQGRRTARVLAMLAIGACLLVAGCTQPGGRDRPGRDGAAGAGSQGDDGNATTAGAPPGRSPTTPTPPPPTNTTPAPPGNDTAGIPHGRLQRTVTVDGLERAFVVHVPQQVTGGTDVPVVFMLHGTGGNGSEYYVRSQWVEQADEDGLIAVFPTAATFCYAEDDDGDGTIGQGEYRIGTKWSAGKLGTPDMPLCGEDLIAQFPAARRADIESRVVVDDVAFFDAMVEALDEELPVDRHRMYVTGFSNGGSMSGRLMVERANTFAAFAMQAGGPTVDGLAARAVPVWFSIGSVDPGFTAAAGVQEFPLDATLFDLPPMRGLKDTLAANAQVNATLYDYDTREVGGETIAMFRFDTSLVGADNTFILAVIGGAEHQYPNGSNHPMVMANALWTFFSAYALP